MNGNSEGYELFYAKLGTTSFKNVRFQDHWTIEYNITGLEAYTQYQIKIRSKNSALWGNNASITVRTGQDSE